MKQTVIVVFIVLFFPFIFPGCSAATDYDRKKRNQLQEAERKNGQLIKAGEARRLYEAKLNKIVLEKKVLIGNKLIENQELGQSEAGQEARRELDK